MSPRTHRLECWAAAARRGSRSALLMALVALGCVAFVPPSRAAARKHGRVHTATVADLFVSPSGSDAAPGTSDRPLRTLGQALVLATEGQRVRLASGSYPAVTDRKLRTQTVLVDGPATRTATVAGLSIAGGRKLTFSGVSFTAPVIVTNGGGSSAGARDITFTNADFTAPESACVTIRSGATNVVLDGVRVHDCRSGVVGPAGGTIPQSTGITVTHSVFERFTEDAVQFGQWNDVTITQNVIAHIRDSAGLKHNDGVQLTGNSQHVMIARNRVSDSRVQLIFIQDSVGPIDDVSIVDNVVSGAGAVAVQSQGATRVSFLHNTVTDTKYGGLWLRAGFVHTGTATTVPSDTVVANNILSTYQTMEGARAGLVAGNVVQCVPPRTAGAAVPGVTCLPDPGFVDPTGGDLRLAATSPARSLGTTLATTALDITGAVRVGPPVPGAFA